MTTMQTEALGGIPERLQTSEFPVSDGLNSIIATEHRYLKDLKINISNVLDSSILSKKEKTLIALAIAVNEKNTEMIRIFESMASANSISEKEIAEVHACVSLMNTNNVFYRFRHFAKKEYYNTKPAGIKMQIMADPLLGKELFELISLCISAVNGCEQCVRSHEESLIKLQCTEEKIFEAIRLSAVLKGFFVLV